MTKNEFIAALRAKLSMLSADEREDAVQFYEEYFDEAGPENEQAVIDELGSPDAVAEKILSGEGKIVQRGWQNGSSSQHPRNKSQKSGNTLPWVLLAIVTSPIWGSVLLALIFVAIGVILAVGGVILGVIAIAMACLLATVLSIATFARDPMNALMLLGIGLTGLGICMVVVPIFWTLIKKGIPAVKMGWKPCWKKVCSFGKKLWEKVKSIG